jgi:hydroxyacylglutathione hydrolase
MQLRDNIYIYEWTNYLDNNCNSYYIGGNVHALIDPGLLRYVPDLMIRLGEDGIDPETIRYIVNTHSHPDHFEGVEYFYGKNLQIALHEAEISFLMGAGGELYSLFGLETPTPQINLELKEGEIFLGDEMFRIIHVPGHSPGSIALYSPSRGALFSGDVIFDQSIGRTDFPGGNGTLLKNSIEKLSVLDVAYLLPGHMGIVDGIRNVKKNFQTIVEYFSPYL